jgi:WD40 repeat protein
MSEPRESAASGALRPVWRTVLPQDARRAVTGALSPSGERVAVGFDGSGGFGHSAGSLAVLSATTGEILRQINDDWRVHFLAYDPGGRFLVTSESRTHVGGPDERRVRVVDAETLDERCHYDEVTHGGWSEDLSFSRDGAWVAGRAGSFREITPMAYVFDAVNGRQRWNRHYPNIYCLALAPDSGSLAVAYDEQTPGGPSEEDAHDRGVAVLDGATGAERFRIHTAPIRVSSIAYSPDGRVIIAGCQDARVRVYDAADGSPRWVAGHSGSTDPVFLSHPVESVAVSDDGRWVAANCVAIDPERNRVGLIAVFDLAHGTLRSPPVRVSRFGRVLYTATLRHVAADARFGWPPVFGADHGLAVIDARTGGTYGGAGGEVRHLASAPDGGSIAAFGEVRGEVGPSRGFIELYDLGIEVSHRDAGSAIAALRTSPGGTPLVAVAGTGAAGTGSAVTVIDAASGVPVAAKPVPGTVASLAFADHGQAVVVGGSDGVRLFSIVGERTWKANTIGVVNGLAVAGTAGEWIAVAAARTVRLLAATDGRGRWPSPNTHPQTVTRVAADPLGTRIATGCADRGTRLLDAETGAATLVAEGDGRVQDLAFTPDGQLLATANQDGTVGLVDVVKASERSRVTRPFGCSRIAFALDGTLLAAAWDDNRVSVHDLTTGESPPPKLRELAFAAPVSGLAFNPAEHTIAIAVAGASLVVYDARDGIELVRILQPAPAGHFAFTADGALIATAGEDRVVRVWTSGTDKEGFHDA